MLTINLSKEIRDKIIKDNSFSLELSMILDIRQVSLFRAVERNSRTLLKKECIDFYIRNGFSEKQIYDVPKIGTE